MLTVHHLDFSRSTRILWCLEEIGQSYSVVSHLREPGFRAPASLRAIHVAGKAPVLIDHELVIAESCVILDHLDARYAGGRFTPDAEAGRLEHAEWMVFAETGLGAPLMTMLYGALIGGLPGILEAIVVREATSALSRLEARIEGPYLFGGALTLADMQLVYVLELAGHLGLLGSYPGTAAYLARLQARPAFQRALAIGGAMMPPPG